MANIAICEKLVERVCVSEPRGMWWVCNVLNTLTPTVAYVSLGEALSNLSADKRV
jgi:hypothetical protein